MRRLAAALAAVLMVAVAVVVRDWLDRRSDPTGAPGPAGAISTLVCVSELEAVCEELAADHDDVEARVEPAGVTIDALVDTDLGPEMPTAWLTFDPLPALVDEHRQRAGLAPIFEPDRSVLARSPLVVAVWNDRLAALADTCEDGEVDWRCLGGVAGMPWVTLGGSEAWGALKPSHPPADETATGLLVLAGAVNSFFGDADYASQDFRDPAFRGWFEQLERSIPQFPVTPRTPLDDMLFGGPATFDLTGTTEAAAGPSIARSRDSDRLTILYPFPVAVADVVFVTVAGTDEGDRVSELVESDATAGALARAGWRVEGQPVAPGIDESVTVPSGPGLPRPGVLEALRGLAAEVRP
jgi:hypothetical protein